MRNLVDVPLAAVARQLSYWVVCAAVAAGLSPGDCWAHGAVPQADAKYRKVGDAGTPAALRAIDAEVSAKGIDKAFLRNVSYVEGVVYEFRRNPDMSVVIDSRQS